MNVSTYLSSSFNANVNVERSSRNQAYDSGESRRSPRDCSPGRYNNEPRDEYRERGGSMRGNERRRSIPDTRMNHNSFQSNRDNFRESIGRDPRDFPPRDPPRGPKGLIDAPTGPRAANFGTEYRGDFGYRGDFRGGRGGRGRGRGWRDDSRDRVREQDREYRDRRDDRGPPPREQFRDDRGRDRDRWDREAFRGRRASSPQGRGRSPNYSQRDLRDAPPLSDIDRARRGSRDGPLSAGSPSADSLQLFVRGYGRARSGRGRGRGGYHEEFHRPPGRSRSPDPNWNRRTQPSATPPPQVPAFGSTSMNLPATGTSSLIVQGASSESISGLVPGVVIPTAPRAHISTSTNEKLASTSRTRANYSSTTWISPTMVTNKQFIIPSKTDDRGSPLLPIASPPTKPSYSPEISAMPSNENVGESHSLEEGQRSALADSNSAPRSVTQTEVLTQQATRRKRRAIGGKRAANTPIPALPGMADDISDSDSGDDLDDGYFDEEIPKVNGEIEKLYERNLFAHRVTPNIFPFTAMRESKINEKVAIYKSDTDGTCVAPEVVTPIVASALKVSSAPEIASSSASKSKGRVNSRPTTPLLGPDQIAKPKTNGKDTTPQADPSAPNHPLDSDHEPQAPSIIVPPAVGANGNVRDVPDQVLGLKPAANPSVNGRRPAPLMDQFEDSEGEQSEAERLETLEAVRKKMKTPPLSNLPNFNCQPWHQDEEFLKTLEPNPIIEAKIRQHLKDKRNQKLQEKEAERQKIKQRYLEYRRWTDFSEDPVAVRSREIFAKSRAKTAAEAAAPPQSSLPTAGAKPEGQRRTGSRFATEHDFERVLRESEQEAKETKEKEERVARARTASAKEATIPDMCWNEEELEANMFIDKSHLVPFDRSFAILEFGEPKDNFTEEESEIFERVYLDFPKQWGKIASGLARRDYKACIQHYYLVKHSSDLKGKLKKQGRKRKGRGAAKGVKAPKSNACVADLRDDAEEGQDGETNGERRRPRRAAAPTWPIETPQSESEVASPAPTPGRKAAATPKGDTANETAPPTKKKAKVVREKGKQGKNSQLLAAAPIATANRPADIPVTPLASTEVKNPHGSAGPSRFPPQYDGAGVGQPAFAPPFVPVDRPNISMLAHFDPGPQLYPSQERVDSAPPMGFDSQLDRRNIQQTSSYWSVPEQIDFPALLKHFGTDWHGIAKFMNSKTHIMVYNTVFQQWLTVPSDSNKSRRVANIQTQVKNYYQRQVDSGKMREWEEMTKEADERRERGEPTGLLPTPAVVPKRRYDVTPNPLTRSGSIVDGLDDTLPPGQNVAISQASPPQPSLSSRFPALAQAGPVPHQPATPTSVLNKHLTPQPIQEAPQQIQVQQQPRPPRGPTLGYFNPERTVLQSDAVSQRSKQAAQEAQLEKSNALRLEREQREQQQQQQAMQRDRQFQMKQENETPSLHQYEPYPPQSLHSSSIVPQLRPEVTQQTFAPSDPRRTAPPRQFHFRNNQELRHLRKDSMGGNREIKSSPSPAISRGPMSAPTSNHESYPTTPQPPPAAPARQQETVLKKSNLMLLLNEEPSNHRPQPAKRVSDVSTSSLQASQTPPPQHPLQPSRYAVHPSQPAFQTPQQISQQMAPQPPQQPSHAQHTYSQPSPHHLHQPSSSIGHPRSYTPTSFDSRSYGPSQPMAQQPQQQHVQRYTQPPRQPISSQPPPLVRREPSLGDMHGMASGYSRSSNSAQHSMRLMESPYSATPPPPQTSRQQVGSPLDLAQPSERDYYPRQSQYLMQQPQSGARSPQIVSSYYHQSAPHHHFAFRNSPSHTASPPPASHATLNSIQRSRHNSFDGGRYQMPATSAPTPAPHGYAPVPQHQVTPLPVQYQQPHRSQDRFDERYDRERSEQERERLRRSEEEHYFRMHTQHR